MTGAAPIDISPDDRRIIFDVLAAYLPPGSRVWVFGSRATGKARRLSDLDLAIDAGRLLSFEETGVLAEAFSDSDLPYRVDIVDWHAIQDSFRRLIAAERIALLE